MSSSGKKRNQAIICLNKDCAQHLGLCEFSAIWVSRLLNWGWAEVIAVLRRSGTLCCRIWKSEGKEDAPKNGITHLWVSVDAFIPPSFWGLRFYGHFYFTLYPHFSFSPLCFIPMSWSRPVRHHQCSLQFNGTEWNHSCNELGRAALPDSTKTTELCVIGCSPHLLLSHAVEIRSVSVWEPNLDPDETMVAATWWWGH